MIESQQQRLAGKGGSPEDEVLTGEPHRSAYFPGQLSLEHGKQVHAVGDGPAKAGPCRERGIHVDGVVISREAGEFVKLVLGEDHRCLGHVGIFDPNRLKHNNIRK